MNFVSANLHRRLDFCEKEVHRTMRTAGALKLNEQLQPVGAQMGYLRSKHCKKTAHPRIDMEHPCVLERMNVLRSQDFRQALRVPDASAVLECQPRTVHDPNPISLYLVQM
jgi:hypothetical protein